MTGVMVLGIATVIIAGIFLQGANSELIGGALLLFGAGAVKCFVS